jgi:T5orf172 domain-containing protein
MSHRSLEDFRRDGEHHVYVAEFSSGTIKVGRTKTPEKRLAEHKSAAGQHGIDITEWWVSGAHKNYTENEAALITYCSARWNAISGKEYFAGANFGDVVAYARTLPMEHWTEAAVEEIQKRVAAGPSLKEFVAAFTLAPAAKVEDQHATNDDDEVEPVLLEDVAPYEFTDSITAASAAKRHTAEALLNHDLRNKLDPFANIRDWKLALSTAQHGYEVSLLLRALIQHAGVAVADEVARTMWSASYENCKEYRDDLVAWATEDGTDLDVLGEMARAAYEQIQKRESYTPPPGWVSGQSELPLEGA